MKKYQLQAIQELKNIDIEKLETKEGLSKYPSSKTVIETIINILEKKENSFVFHDYANKSVAILFNELNLTNYEKMHLFFDLLESPSKMIGQDSSAYFLHNRIYSFSNYEDVQFIFKILKLFSDKQESNPLIQSLFRIISSFDDGKNNEEIESEIISEINKKLITRTIKDSFPNQRQDLPSIIEDGEMRNKNFQKALLMLHQHYYLLKGRPTWEDSLAIFNALGLLNIPYVYIMRIMEELEKDLRIEKEKKNDLAKQSMELNMDLKVEGKPVLSNKEWRELNEKAKSYYDIDSNLPIRGLDLKEKIEFIQILRTMEYKEEDIEKILWSIDEAFPQTTITNKSDSAMYNALIIKNFMKKAKEQKSGEISSDVKEIFSNLSTCEENQRKEWLVILEEITKEENDSIKEELLNKREELKKMSFVNKKTWVDVYKENAQCKTHSSVILLQRIFKEVQTCSKEEKELWKQIFIETLERYQIEQYGNYNYELSVSRKLEKNANKF